MISKTVLITDPVGLHARPAAVASKLASKCKSIVTLEYNGKQTNMKSIMGIMSLGIPAYKEVEIICNGDSRANEQGDLDSILEGLLEEEIIAD